MIIETIGIESPIGFPTQEYNNIHKLLLEFGYDKSHFDLWREWAGAWNGLIYRYQTCYDCNQSYITSIKVGTGTPEPQERYNQERDLFNFFMSGFSAIECLCYALFAIASIKDQNNFPLATPNDKKAVTYKILLSKFEVSFPSVDLTKNLRQVINSKEFSDWSEIRNLLAHRATPSRLFRHGGDRHGQTDWGNFNLNEGTINSRLEWLSKTLESLLNDLNKFIGNRANKSS